MMKKTRRSHIKSRNGCTECKRRRLKCDESKPSCSRCIKLLSRCVYSIASPNSVGNEIDGSHAENTPLSFGNSSQSTPASRTSVLDFPDAQEIWSEARLYDYYIHHTVHTLNHLRQDQNGLRTGILELASQSDTVRYALLAVSAASVCCDLISKDSQPATNVINEILMAGYRYYNLASERIRESLSHPDASEVGYLLGSAGLLVPFATASQQINHWISTHTVAVQESSKPLSSTPRDVIVIMRGIKAMREALAPGISDRNIEGTSAAEGEISTDDTKSAIIELLMAPSRTHAMYSMLASTSHQAFTILNDHLVSALRRQNDFHNDALAACRSAFDLLSDLRSNTFSITPSLLNEAALRSAASPASSPSQMAPWLRSFSPKHAIPLPTEPLTVYLLTFLVKTPTSYLDLVLPLLDQRLAKPQGSGTEHVTVDLTEEQALGLDIYAHWSVLMMLTEDESWWIGSLPVVTLTGMINAFGSSFVQKLWPADNGEDQWWPGCMLKILQEVKSYLRSQ